MKEEVLKIINYSLGRKRETFGHGFESAYHTIKIGDKKIEGQRDIERRFENIDYDFKGKSVIDFGCNIGGMLHEISDDISFGIGLDYNSKVINAANLINAANEKNNINFYTFNLDKEKLKIVDGFTLGKKIDVCFVLAIALWVKRWKEVVKYCYNISDTLIYESNGDNRFQLEQQDFLKTLYSDVKLLAEKSMDDNRTDAQSKRRMLFICQK
jgi:SAM-dependent methyltransferase